MRSTRFLFASSPPRLTSVPSLLPAGHLLTTRTTNPALTSSRASSESFRSLTRSRVSPPEPTPRSSPSFTSSSTLLNTRPSSRSRGSEAIRSRSLTTPSTSSTRSMASSTRTETPFQTSSSLSSRTRRTSFFARPSRLLSLLLLLQRPLPLLPPDAIPRLPPPPPLPPPTPQPRPPPLPQQPRWPQNDRVSSLRPSPAQQPSRAWPLPSRVSPSDGNQEEGSPRSDPSSRTRSSRSWTRSVTLTSIISDASSRTRGRRLGSGTRLRF